MFREWDDVMARAARRQMILAVPTGLFFAVLFVVTGIQALTDHASVAGPLVGAFCLALNVWTWVEKRGQLARYEKRRAERENAKGAERMTAARATRLDREAARKSDPGAAGG